MIPKIKGYEYRQTVVEYEDGTITHHLVKVPISYLSRWDREHDSAGRKKETETS